MKPSFLHRLVNSPFDDPVVFLKIIHEKRALLLDAGDLSKLRPADLQKISHVFITHTHIDHFIGFDTLIRALLRRELPLHVYGPSNIAECVEGKLKGYTWNLVREYPLKIEVYSINGDKLCHSSFFAADGFERKEHGMRIAREVLIRDPLFTVKVLELNHQIPSLAYSIEEDFHININKSLLKEKDLPVGPWLSDFKRAIREQAPDELEFIIAARRYAFAELRPIAHITRGQKISYVTDVSISEDNIRKIVDFVRDSDTFYCEAYFMHRDIERANTRFHLTAKIAGSIAREARVKHLVAMHFSPRYRNQPDDPAREALEEFMRSPA